MNNKCNLLISAMSSAKDLRLGLIFTKRAYFQKLKNVAFQIKSLTCILILQLTPHFLTISICIFQKRQKLLIHGICEPNPNPNQSASNLFDVKRSRDNTTRLSGSYVCYLRFEEQTANFVHDAPYLLLNWSKAINSLYCWRKGTMLNYTYIIAVNLVNTNFHYKLALYTSLAHIFIPL